MSDLVPRRVWLPALFLLGAMVSVAQPQGQGTPPTPPPPPPPKGPGGQPPDNVQPKPPGPAAPPPAAPPGNMQPKPPGTPPAAGEKTDPPKATDPPPAGGNTVKRKDAVKPPPPPPPAPPVKYDEDENPVPPKVKKPIVPDEEGPPPVTVPRGSYYIRLNDLIEGSNKSKHPLVKQVLGRFSVAHDRITDTSDRILRVTPIPLHKTEQLPPRFGIYLLNDENAPRNVMGMNLQDVKKFEHYEEMVAAEVKKLADVGGQPTVYDPADPKERLLAAERLLVGVLQFHDGARDQNKRRGKGWEPVKTALGDQLAAVRVKRIKFAAANKEWNMVRELGARMGTLYPNNKPLLAEVFGARLLEAESVVLATNSPTELERARNTLDEYKREFDEVKSDTRTRLEAALKRKIKQLFDDAERAVKTDSPDARALVGAVELLEPEYPGLRDLQAQMKSGYSILYVAVNQLPERMTPMTARYDSEKMAVELLYEGLLEQLPDEAFGVKFRPALASGMPVPSGLSRDIPLARPVEWGAPVGGLFDASDVAGTLKLLRIHRHTWAADGIEWLDDQARVDDPTRVRIGYMSGHPFPLSLLTFKVMPAKWLASQGKAADDAAFALRPIGTGPYKLATTPKDGGPREVVFVANPTYARRPGRVGQPFIKEIRFVEVKSIANASNEFKSEKLHIMTDVPTQEIDKYKSGGVQALTALQNRRIYMLAVNQRKPQLQSPALRRGMAHAIDREQILSDVYRGSHPETHKPLAGPYPSTAWATPRPLGAPPPMLFNKDMAQSKFREHAKKFGPAVMSLTFPNDDPRAAAACAAMKKQIEAVGEGDEGRIVVKLDPQTPEDLYRKVYEEGGYDLAYVPFDYKDDLYPFALASLLDPTAAERNGRNFLGYLVKSNNPAAEDERLSLTLLETRAHADPARLELLAHETFRRFNEAMPFIPLWQLDRHMVVRTTVKIGFDGNADATAVRLLPPRLFPAVGLWRME